MNAQTLQALARARHVDEFHQQRVDQVSHTIVNHGIALQTHSNTICAVEYLKSQNVAAGVIERVLLHPDQRRRNAH